MKILIVVLFLLNIIAVRWVISTQRTLVVLDDIINNAMSEIGVQLSYRFDAVTALLDLTKGYAPYEVQTLMETIRSGRSVITAKSTPDEVFRQESFLNEALARILLVAEQCPELKMNENYMKYMDAVCGYEKVVRTCRSTYNDSVTKFNRLIRIVPIGMLAARLGFKKRDYLETAAERSDR